MNELTAQLKNLLKERKNILLLSHQKIDGDGLSSMIALKKLLEKHGKDVTAFTPGLVPDIYHFLPWVNEVETTLRGSNDFVISLQSPNAEVDKIRYSVDGDTLNIVVTPKFGNFVAEDIATKQSVGTYDLIIVMDSGDLEHLGKFYEENTDLFYETPIVNMDHHITNTGFGQLNMVDVTAASTTEIVYQVIQNMEEDPKAFMNEDIATLLLTGLIVDTGSFQHTNTSPKALEFAADLIEMGARQQEIIQNIYKTKQLSTLKLWGRILAKIQEDPIRKLVWSTVTKEDLVETGATLEEADGLIDELMTNAPGADLVILLKDSLENNMSASLRSTSVAVNTLEIAQHFGGGGHKQASGFKQKGNNFNLFVADVINVAEKFQQNRLALTEEDIQQMQEELQTKRANLAEENQMDLELPDEGVSEKRDILSEMVYTDQGTVKNNQKGKEKKKDDKKNKKQESKKDNKQDQKPVENTEKKEEKKEKKNNKQQDQKRESQNEQKDNKKEVKKEGENKQGEGKKKKKKDNKQKQDQQKSDSNSAQAPQDKQQKQLNEKKGDKKQGEKKQKQEQPVVEQQAQAQVQQEAPVVQAEPAGQAQPQAQAVADAQVVDQNAQQQAVAQDQAAQQQAQAAQQQPTKEQAAQYAAYYAQQLQQMNQQSPEYAQTYQYYHYYAQMAQ